MMHHGGRPLSEAEVLQRLRENVRTDGDCLLWAGATDGRGHPRIMWRGTRYTARNLLLQLAGRMPRDAQGLIAWPTCGTKACMSERHLRIVTRADIAKLNAAHGRQSRGVAHAVAVMRARCRPLRLPPSERAAVAEARLAGASWRQIGHRYSISGTAARKAWLKWERVFGPFGPGLSPGQHTTTRTAT